MILICVPLFAQEQNNQTDLSNEMPEYTLADLSTSTPPEEFNYWKEFMQMLFSLGVIVIILLFGAWFLRRFVNKKVLQGNSANLIKIIETRPLSHKASLYLIEVHDKTILISASPSGVTSLTECSPLKAPEIPSLEEKTSAKTTPFSQILKKLKMEAKHAQKK